MKPLSLSLCLMLSFPTANGQSMPSVKQIEALAGQLSTKLSRVAAQLPTNAPAVALDLSRRLIERMKLLANGEKEVAESTPEGRLEQREATEENSKFTQWLSLDGIPVNEDSYQGRVVVVVFWATWCGACQAAGPGMEQIARHYQDRGVDVLGVNLNEDPAEASTFVANAKWKVPQMRGDSFLGSKIGSEVDFDSIPYFIIIGRDGKLAAKDLRLADLDAAIQVVLARD